MRHGESEAKIREQARLTNTPLPDAIANKPDMYLGNEFYWKAFWEVSTDRDFGMGEGPIPWSSINTWGLRHGVWGEDFDRLVYVLRGMDNAYIEFRVEQRKKEEKRNQRRAKSGIGRK